MAMSGELVSYLLALVMGTDVPPVEELNALAPCDFVQVVKKSPPAALWVMITDITGEEITGVVVAGGEFGMSLTCQRQHVVSLAPWEFLAQEQRERIRRNLITSTDRPLLKALVRAAWINWARRFHADLDVGSPFNVEREAVWYQRVVEQDSETLSRAVATRQLLEFLADPEGYKGREALMDAWEGLRERCIRSAREKWDPIRRQVMVEVPINLLRQVAVTLGRVPLSRVLGLGDFGIGDLGTGSRWEVLSLAADGSSAAFQPPPGTQREPVPESLEGFLRIIFVPRLR
jgi:hypothetical protein